MLHGAYTRTPTFYRKLVEKFRDPSGRGRRPVVINVDATYIDVAHSQDASLQKSLFYSPRNGHTVKVLNFSDLTGKVIGLLPLASSQSPSSGDAYLTRTYCNMMDESNSANYFREIIAGNDDYFIILVTDAGFVISASNQPRQVRNCPELSEVCLQEHCVLLHTSNKGLSINYLQL